MKIISGGQTGADQGGLRAARTLGIESGGWAPLGWITEDGPQKELLRFYGLLEYSGFGYPARTKANVEASDGTIIFGEATSNGSALTARIAAKCFKPAFFVAPHNFLGGPLAVDLKPVFLGWLKTHHILILNVAGNRESKNPGIGAATKRFLIEALS